MVLKEQLRLSRIGYGLSVNLELRPSSTNLVNRLLQSYKHPSRNRSLI